MMTPDVPPPKAPKSIVSTKQSVANTAYMVIVANGVWGQRVKYPKMNIPPVSNIEKKCRNCSPAGKLAFCKPNAAAGKKYSTSPKTPHNSNTAEISKSPMGMYVFALSNVSLLSDAKKPAHKGLSGTRGFNPLQ